MQDDVVREGIPFEVVREALAHVWSERHSFQVVRSVALGPGLCGVAFHRFPLSTPVALGQSPKLPTAPWLGPGAYVLELLDPLEPNWDTALPGAFEA